MSRRTEQLSTIDRWESLRTRFLSACALGTILIVALLIVSENAEEHWANLPLSLAFALTGAIALAGCMLLAGMMLRWQTLPRRLTLPGTATLLAAGVFGAVFCITATDNAPRNPLGVAELRHAPVYLASLAAAAFGAVNWPARPRSPRHAER